MLKKLTDSFKSGFNRLGSFSTTTPSIPPEEKDDYEKIGNYCFSDEEITGLNLNEVQNNNLLNKDHFSHNPVESTDRKKCTNDLNLIGLRPSQIIKLPNRFVEGGGVLLERNPKNRLAKQNDLPRNQRKLVATTKNDNSAFSFNMYSKTYILKRIYFLVSGRFPEKQLNIHDNEHRLNLTSFDFTSGSISTSTLLLFSASTSVSATSRFSSDPRTVTSSSDS